MLKQIPQTSNGILPAKSSDFPGGLVMHYDFQDLGSSKIIDKSGMGNHGTLSGANGLPELRPALNGYCRYFDGVDDAVSKAETATNNVITGDFTISAWLSVPVWPQGASTPLFGKRGAANSFSCQITNNGSVWLHFWPASGDMQTVRTLNTAPNSILVLNTIYNVVLKYNTAESGTNKCLYIYLNGVDKTYDEGVITAAAFNQSTAALSIGTHNWGSFSNETVYDFKVFNRALTDTEIKEIFQNEAWRFGQSV